MALSKSANAPGRKTSRQEGTSLAYACRTTLRWSAWSLAPGCTPANTRRLSAMAWTFGPNASSD
eukprot:7197005-Lingulodinium_polyedra.AAC.1